MAFHEKGPVDSCVGTVGTIAVTYSATASIEFNQHRQTARRDGRQGPWQAGVRSQSKTDDGGQREGIAEDGYAKTSGCHRRRKAKDETRCEAP